MSIADLIKLEVSADPPPGQLVNLLPNPTGDYGGSGWTTYAAGAIMSRSPSYDRHLEYRAGGTAANRIDSDYLPVAPGQWVGASIRAGIVTGVIRVRFLFYNASKVYLGASTGATAYSPWWGGSGARRNYTPAQVPATAAFVILSIEHAGSAAGGAPRKSARVVMNQLMVATGPNAAAVTDPPYSEVQFWTDVTADVVKIDVERLVLDVGSVEVTLKGNHLDPAVSETLKSGRRVQLSAWDGTEWDVVVRATMQRPRATYDPRRKALGLPDAATVTFAAIDDNQKLSRTRALGTYDLASLPWVLESGGVPWSVNGVTAQVAAPAAARQYQASADTTLLNHVLRTRNGYYGIGRTYWIGAWIDRFGVLQAWDVDAMRTDLRGLIRDRSFASSVDEWDPAGNVALAHVTGHATYGTALRATVGAAGNAIWQTGDLPVTPGAEYAVSFTLRPTVAGRRLLSYLTWLDTSGLPLSSTIIADTTSYSTGRYLGYDQLRTAPPDAAFVRLHHVIYGAAAGEAVYSNRGEVYRYAEAVLTEGDWSDVVSGWDDDDNFNSLALDNVVGTGSNAAQITHGPFEDAASIAVYGPRPATVETCGWAPGNANLAAYTGYLLSRNATPAEHVQSVVIPIRNAAEVKRHAFRDLYDRLRFTAPIPDHCHVTRVTHSIQATRNGGQWITTLETGDLDRLVL